MPAFQTLTALQANEPEVAPQTVDRTLSAWTDQGRVCRLELAKAFGSYSRDHAVSVSVLENCADCGSEDGNGCEKLVSRLSSLVSSSGFHPKWHVVEIYDLNRSCTA